VTIAADTSLLQRVATRDDPSEAARAMGGEVFVTFGRGAEKRLRAAGHATRLLRRARR
jgi:hypothetical protein